MPVQTPQWSEYLSCPVCQNEFEVKRKPPISLGSGHTVCKACLFSLQRSPFDQTPISPDLPVNTALLQLIGTGQVPEEYRRLPPSLGPRDRQSYSAALHSVEDTALFLKPGQSAQLSRPMQRKLVTLVNCQLAEAEGRARAVRSARSLGERSVTELILQHQNPQQLSANLWAGVRARGCQFLGPAMQEEVLKLVLLALEEGSALSRKVLVMYVVQKLETHYPQASKTSIGHVVQLLYRASCFKVTKRDGDSSLMQLKEEFRSYETLRREHDTQIVQIATEAGLRIAPDQWSSLLYADAGHKSHMQSIIDKLQTPQSFGQSVQELVIALQRTGDPGNLSSLRPHLDALTSIDPAPEAEAAVQVSWAQVLASLEAALAVVTGLVSYCALSGHRRTGESYPGAGGHVTRYKTSLCRDLAQHGSCPRGNNCTFAHSQAELEIHRRQGPRRQLGPSRGRDDSLSTHGTPSPTPVHVASPEPGNRSSRPEMENQFETRSLRLETEKTPVNTESVVTAAAPDLKPTGGPAVQAHAGQHAPSLPVAQVAPTPRVVPRETFHVTPLVDQNGAPMIDPATGQQLVAAPMMAHAHGQAVFQPSVQIAGADGAVYAVQVAPAMVVAPPNQVQGVQQIIVQQPQQAHGPVVQTVQTPAQPQIQRDMKHDLSPEIASKSLNALKDRKEEILTELGDIMGETNAELIGDIAKKQAVVEDSRMVETQDDSGSRRNSLLLQQQSHQNQQQHKVAKPQRQPAQPQQPQRQQKPVPTKQQQQHQFQQPPPQQQQQHYQDKAPEGNPFSIWTSKPLVTMSSLKDKRPDVDEGVEDLPEGICVSRFGPISRSKETGMRRQGSEPRAVTANIGQATRSTSTMRHPLASASPLPDGLLMRQDHFSVLNYDPGYSYGPGYCPNIQEGMDSVSMTHLAYPPLTPVSPLPHPRDQTQARLSSQNLTMFAESARIQKELTDLQRRISSLSVSEADQAMKRDRLAFELRMIESGIRDRQNEIQQNQNRPGPGHSSSQQYSYW